jgi:hypothetical protein
LPEAVSGATSPSPTATTVCTDVISGSAAASSGTSDMSTSTTRSSAWLAMNAICSPASRMFSVCSTAPMHGAAK